MSEFLRQSQRKVFGTVVTANSESFVEEIDSVAGEGRVFILFDESI
jgi:hypothetical protein